MRDFILKNTVALVIFIIALVFSIFLAIYSALAIKKVEYEPIHTQSIIVDDVLGEQNAEDTYVIPKDAWYLKLVNKDNPIGADYVINVKAINPIGYFFDERALEAIQTMLADGEKEGMRFKISSAYRTLERQAALYQQKVVEFLAAGYTQVDAEIAASELVSPPGTSEHNLGLGIDIISTTTTVMDETFEQSPEFAWLMEHCTEYGFILRYPKDKEEITKVTYEPWHFRYVGIEDAKRITEQGVCLEEYLV